MCLIKRIPLKSVMECWISFASHVWDNRGKRRDASMLENLRLLISGVGGGGHQQKKAREKAHGYLRTGVELFRNQFQTKMTH